jgi:hypothetical protein
MTFIASIVLIASAVLVAAAAGASRVEALICVEYLSR